MAKENSVHYAIEIVKAMALGGNKSLSIANPKIVGAFIESVANKIDELRKEK